MAINKALKDVEEKNIGSIPAHLRDQSYSGAKKLGHGVGYLYPHDYEGNYVKQQYLPDELVGTVYYEASIMDMRKKLKSDLRVKDN